MVPPLFVNVADPNVVRAPNTPSTPVIITGNNVTFSPVIPSKLQGEGLEDFMAYLQAHPLRYALENIPEPFLPNHICEFYYTCTYNPDNHTLNGKIAAGTQPVSISPTTVRNALQLPILQVYPDHPSEADCKAILPRIGYDVALQGTRIGTQFVLR